MLIFMRCSSPDWMMKHKLMRVLVPRLIWMVYTLLRWTIRWEYVGNIYEAGQKQRFMVALWHSRILMMPLAFIGWKGRLLISEHRDGEYISSAVALMGLQSVRGSSTRGGVRAALQMLRIAKRENCDLGVTPDGPKGPREVAKRGIVQLALKVGYPILPVSYATKRYHRMRSWDQFYIPMPFTQGVFVYGDYVFPHEGEATDAFLSRVQIAMDKTNKTAEAYFAIES